MFQVRNFRHSYGFCAIWGTKIKGKTDQECVFQLFYRKMSAISQIHRIGPSLGETFWCVLYTSVATQLSIGFHHCWSVNSKNRSKSLWCMSYLVSFVVAFIILGNVVARLVVGSAGWSERNRTAIRIQYSSWMCS